MTQPVPLWRILGWEYSRGQVREPIAGRQVAGYPRGWVSERHADRHVGEANLLDWLEANTIYWAISVMGGEHPHRHVEAHINFERGWVRADMPNRRAAVESVVRQVWESTAAVNRQATP